MSHLFKFCNTSGTQVGPHLTNFWPNQESQPEMENLIYIKFLFVYCWLLGRGSGARDNLPENSNELPDDASFI